VVVEDELLGARGAGQLDGGDEGAVAPAGLGHAPDLAGVLLGGVHGVVDQQVDVLAEAAELGVDDRVMLGVGRVDDALALVVDAVGVDPVGVVAPRVGDPHVVADLEHLALAQIVEVHLGAHLGQVDRETRIVHLSSEGLLEGARDVAAAVQVDLVARDEGRGKEREALDVIPVDVAEEQKSLDGHLAQQLLPEHAQPRAAIEDDDVLAAAHLEAAGVAAHLDGIGARGRDAAAHPPTGDLHASGS
jgi:hypothetical protein